MIAQLRGRVASLGPDHVVVDVQGVGYLVHTPARTLHDLPPPGGSVELHVETQLRAESLALYGFLDPAERLWFRQLQTVQGVGARVALAILGVLRAAEVATAIAAQDRTALTRAAGVGPRLAARICAELKDRAADAPVPSVATPSAAASGTVDAEALSALVNLGYGRSEAWSALQRVMSAAPTKPTLDAVLRDALKELAQ